MLCKACKYSYNHPTYISGDIPFISLVFESRHPDTMVGSLMEVLACPKCGTLQINLESEQNGDKD